MASPGVQVDVVRRAQAGERAAFAELYEAYFDAVYGFCYQLTRSAAERLLPRLASHWRSFD